MHNGNFLKQVDGVTIGSPLESTLANFFISLHLKQKTFANASNSMSELSCATGTLMTYLQFLILPMTVTVFLQILNSQHPNIKLFCGKGN